MSWRFRKQVTLFPGVTLNFSKSGVSTTFGVPGASVNVGKEGMFFNAGIPGSGIYSRSKIVDFSAKDSSNNNPYNAEVFYFQPLNEGEIKSAAVNSITSDGLKGLKETLLAVYEEEKLLKDEVSRAKTELNHAEKRLNRFRLIPFSQKIFPKGYNLRQECLKDKQEQLEELKEQLNLCNVQINVEFNESLNSTYNNLRNSFDRLKQSEYIWDLVIQLDIDRVKTRSAAYQSIDRKKINFSWGQLSFIKSKYDAFLFKNYNGADLYLYPGFIVFFSNQKEFSLIDFRDLNIEYSFTRFIEEEYIPSDTTIIDKTWAKVNKDGSRDKRFVNNYEIPIVSYGKLHFNSANGLNEKYLFSNNSSAQGFSTAFYDFKSALSGNYRNNEKPRTKLTDNSKRNWAFNILGLTDKATADDIKNAYYSLIKKYHPDKVDGLGDEFKTLAEAKTKELNEAYNLLKK